MLSRLLVSRPPNPTLLQMLQSLSPLSRIGTRCFSACPGLFFATKYLFHRYDMRTLPSSATHPLGGCQREVEFQNPIVGSPAEPDETSDPSSASFLPARLCGRTCAKTRENVSGRTCAPWRSWHAQVHPAGAGHCFAGRLAGIRDLLEHPATAPWCEPEGWARGQAGVVGFFLSTPGFFFVSILQGSSASVGVVTII